MITYFNDYFKVLQSKPIEEITEHSHRTPLENLLNAIAQHHKYKLQILHEPKRQQGFGAPDFKISNSGSIVGYVENKKSDENLSKLYNSNQIKKYKALNDNILLTNYKEFVWIKGDEVTSKTLFTDWDLLNRTATLNEKNVHEVEELILKFYSQPPVKIATAKKLAEALAVRAKYLKDFLNEELTDQHNNNKQDKLIGLYETFKTYVFHELTIEEFADAFAQNLAYGLFLAKLNAKAQQVTLLNAKEFIPHSFELIRELVDFLDELKNKQYAPTRWIVEEVLTIMNNFDQQEIQRSLFYRRVKATDIFDETNYSFTDPFIYFYEHFLAAYDKALRKAKGVYYTPPPIVNFIVRAIDDILKTSFNIKDGLADMNKVTVLDFATGTGTFLVDIMQRIIDNTLPKTADRRLMVKEHILKNLYGFEYLIAPYTIAHLKLSQYLKDAGYPLESSERLQVYLTNTLEPIYKQIKIPLLPGLTKETQLAQKVKDNPILVITGNPPYSIHSKNTGDWILEQIEKYKPRDEKKINIDDDYIKFIRFAQEKMDRVENGIVAIISNNSFLNGITHRKMRNSLLETFNEIFIINLHGNYRIKEKTPEGKIDENVFDIMQGVSINIFIKTKIKLKSSEVKYIDVWGNRKYKENYCWNTTLSQEKFITINIEEFNKIFRSTKWGQNRFIDDLSFFVPKTNHEIDKYGNGWGLHEIFRKYSVGIKTKINSIATDFNDQILKKRIKDILLKKPSLTKIVEEFEISKKTTWEYTKALKAVYDDNKIVEYDLAPFNKRFIFYDKDFLSRSRSEIMNSFFHRENIGLETSRLDEFVSFISDRISDEHFGGPASYKMPLYVYDENKKLENFKNEFKCNSYYLI